MILALALLAAASSATVTDCDRLAAHPSDPDKLTAGVASGEVDLPRAIAACQASVAASPKDPRQNYQLARVLGYAGRGDEATPYREAAVAGDYRQALFVVGYIHLLGLNKAPQDVCRAGELIRRSALKGRHAGQVGFPHWALLGRFDACPVRKDWTEMAGFLAEARKTTPPGDFYQTILIDQLEAEVRARSAK